MFRLLLDLANKTLSPPETELPALEPELAVTTPVPFTLNTALPVPAARSSAPAKILVVPIEDNPLYLPDPPNLLIVSSTIVQPPINPALAVTTPVDFTLNTALPVPLFILAAPAKNQLGRFN